MKKFLKVLGKIFVGILHVLGFIATCGNIAIYEQECNDLKNHRRKEDEWR